MEGKPSRANRPYARDDNVAAGDLFLGLLLGRDLATIAVMLL
jgi:hypothetical protein